MTRLSDSRTLWSEYCSFYEKSFSEQITFNMQRLTEQLQVWTRTTTAANLNCKGVKDIAQTPLTVYSDYPFLDDFGRIVENRVNTTRKKKSESSYEYYVRTFHSLSSDIKDYIPGNLAACARTSGTSGHAKWMIWCEAFFQNLVCDARAAAILSCADSWGETRLETGDTMFNVVAPVPYISGYGLEAMQPLFRILPPIEITDKISDMRRKLYIALDLIDKGARVDIAGGIASTFYLVCRYFSDREDFLKDYSDSFGFGLPKLLLLTKWFLSRFRSQRVTDLKALLPIKGILCAGVDTSLYRTYFKEVFGLEIAESYGSTEFGVAMLSPPDKKDVLMPNLRTIFLEFLDEKGELRSLQEVKRNEVYAIVGTPFGTPLVRYNIGDRVRVITTRDDGMPLFRFEGRSDNYLEIYGYVRVTESMAVEAMRKAGMRLSDKWVIAKMTEPFEHLCLLMEKEWDYDEDEASKRIFDSLEDTSPSFQEYVKDFRIKDPKQVVRVRYLKKGAFLRYMLSRGKSGAPLGQMKPPKLVPANRMDVYDTLRSS